MMTLGSDMCGLGMSDSHDAALAASSHWRKSRIPGGMSPNLHLFSTNVFEKFSTNQYNLSLTISKNENRIELAFKGN